MSEQHDPLDRRSALKLTAGPAVALAVGGVAASGTALAGRRGGRALVDGTVRPNTPFEVTMTGSEDLGASCMSGRSAEQTYHVYDVAYCPPDDVPCVMYVHPDEADVDPDLQYLFRSKKDCKASDLVKASFGPSNRSC